MARYDRGVLVTGGGTFLGDSIAAALLAAGAEVSLLVRAGTEDQLGPLAHHTRWSTADVWNPASLRGKARFHSAVIHTVGSLSADPAQGLSFHRLNFVSARNVANMCISDGVDRMILLSGVSAPWVRRSYIQSKREAEHYLRRIGLNASIVRAPLLYVSGRPRPLIYKISTVLGYVPPLSWLAFGRIAPMSIDVFARGVARITLSSDPHKPIYFPGDLRRFNRSGEITHAGDTIASFLPQRTQGLSPYDAIEENLPFGWAPTDKQ